MVSGMLCIATIHLRKLYAKSSAVDSSLYGMKIPNFVNQLVMTSIELNTVSVIGSLEGGSLTIQSRATDCQGRPSRS